MARRKTKRYGSPPDIHAYKARSALTIASRRARSFRAHMKAGNCNVALGALTDTAEEVGRYMAERQGAGAMRQKTGFHSAKAIVAKMERAFLRACVK